MFQKNSLNSSRVQPEQKRKRKHLRFLVLNTLLVLNKVMKKHTKREDQHYCGHL